MPPMAPTIEKNKIIAFHTASASDSILNAGDFIFATNIKVQNEARHVAEYAFNNLRARTASVLYVTTDFGQDYKKYFTERFAELGGKILSSDTNSPGSNDFRTELTRVKAKNPDVVFAAHLGPTLGILLKQARSLGVNTQVLGVYEAEDPSVLETAGKSAEGLQFFVPEPILVTDKIQQFQKEFNARYGHAARILASNAYDATKLLVEALSQCKLDSECTKLKLYNLSNYDGVSGKFSIAKDGGTEKDFVLKTVENGNFLKTTPNGVTQNK